MVNRAMPGLVKIGFSQKDPKLRAQELGRTGLPYPFEVIYDVLVIDPREVEQQVHHDLARWHESKEFFQVEVIKAIETVKAVVASQGKVPLLEKSNFVPRAPQSTTNPFLDADGKPKRGYEKSAAAWRRRDE